MPDHSINENCAGKTGSPASLQGKALDWSQLVVVKTDGGVPNKIGWQAGPDLFPAQRCARHVYVGFEPDFADVPGKLWEHERTEKLTGKEAYRFFVAFFADLLNFHRPLQAKAAQTRLAWKRFVEGPSRHEKLQRYMDAMLHDGCLIKTSILNPHLCRPTPANTAVRIAGLSQDSKVLVVGGADAISVEAIKALGLKKPYTPDVITLTHPDAAALNGIVGRIAEARKDGSIQAEVIQVPFDQAMQEDPLITTMYNANAVFICQPMTEDTTSKLGIINERLLEAWELRCMVDPDHGAKLIHLKGDPLLRGETSGAWSDRQEMAGFISFTQLQAENGERIKFKMAVGRKAMEAVEHMAELRAQGDRVVEISFNPQEEGMPITYKLARRPLGAAAAPGSRIGVCDQ